MGVFVAIPRVCDTLLFSRAFNNREEISLLEPGTAPRKVQVRPLSSSTMVIQWDEPETPNGQVTVGISPARVLCGAKLIWLIVVSRVSFAGIQSVLHDGLESTDGLVAVPNGGQQSADDDLRADATHDLHHKSPSAHERRSRAAQSTGANQNAARGTESARNANGGRHRGDQSNAPMEQARS